MSNQKKLDDIVESSSEEKKETEPQKSRYWGQIPADWSLVEGSGEAYEVNPSHDPDTDENTYIEMDALDTELPHPKYFGTREAADYSGKTFTEGDVLFARITPCTENGKAALVPEMESRVGIGSTEYSVLSPDTDKLVPHFLYYLAKSHPIHDYAVSRMRGSTGRQRVPFDVFRREIDIPLPPLSEQRKIASVLYNVDEAIRKTEEIIEQTKRVKKGVMQELFTEGYHEHDETKEGTIRWKEIPKSWSLPKVNDVADVNPSYDEVDKMTDYIEMDAVDTELPEPSYVGKRNPSENSGRLFSEGDTLFARITPCTENGKICFVDSIESDVGIGSTEYAVLSPNDEILPKYLYHYTRTHQVRDYAISRMRGSTGRQRVPFDVFRKELHIPLPPKDEQGEIVDALDSIDGIVRNNREQRAQSHRLKRALMQDLLTGEVRTKDRDIEVLPEVEAHG